MIKYAKIIDNTTKECSVGLGTNSAFYQSIGMMEMDIEQAPNGRWYVTGYAPQKTYIEKRLEEYPNIAEQLDMLYWDKVNGTNNWQNKITEIKNKYPKE